MAKFDKIICHYGEIALKGKNRGFFEKKLLSNVKRTLNSCSVGFSLVQRISGRIVIEVRGFENISRALDCLRLVFGLVNISPACEISPNIESVKNKALELLSNEKFNTFKIEARRSNKNFDFTSREVNEKVGEAVVSQLDKAVNLSDPDIVLFADFLTGKTFVYFDKLKAPGGLPVSTGGRALVLISGGFDSPVASYLTMKRGVHTDFIHFHSYPYTGWDSVEKTKNIVSVLNRYQGVSNLYLVPLAELQKRIVAGAHEKFRIIIYRRLMAKIASEIAKKNNIPVVVTGESVGQVASQTLKNISAIDDSYTLPVLRPLIGFNKEEIIKISREIGLYNLSLAPCDDTCSWLMPQNPTTGANLKEVKKAEKNLGLDDLYKKTVKEIQQEQISENWEYPV